MAKQAVLLLAHGTPETLEQIPEYLLKVTGGRPLPEAVVREIQHRYSLIGKSPLTEITLGQAQLVEAELAGLGQPVRVYVGMRNWDPSISDVLHQIKADGVEQLAVICLAPQNSRTSVGLYRRAVEAAAEGLQIDFTEGWAQNPLLIEAFAERLRPVAAKVVAATGAPARVLFTAHSVPCRTIQTPAARVGAAVEQRTGPALVSPLAPDPYAEDAKATARLVAEAVPNVGQWWFAFQSQGASGGPWIGPTVEETLRALAAEGVKNLILQPIGFLCDHVEILYDIDHLFAELCISLNMQMIRPESLNLSALLARAVAELAEVALRRLQ